MAATRDVAAQVVAVSTVLEGLKGADEDTYRRVAAAQRAALEAAMRQTGLPVTEAAMVVQAVQASAFPPDEKRALMLAISSLPTLSQSPAKGPKYQSYESLLAFVPQSLQALAPSADFGPRFLEFLLRAGLRSPSEPTYQIMTIAMLVGSEGTEKAMGFSSESRAAMIVSTKSWFRRLVAKAPPPSCKLAALPATPTELKHDNPQLFEELFSVDPPSLAPLIDPISVEVLRSSTRMRKSKSLDMLPCNKREGGSPDSKGAVTWTDLQKILMNGCLQPTNLTVFGKARSAMPASSLPSFSFPAAQSLVPHMSLRCMPALPPTPATPAPAPATLAPATPAPAMPAPMEPAPVTLAPLTLATPAPAMPAPLEPEPVTLAPVSLATPAPSTPAPMDSAQATPALDSERDRQRKAARVLDLNKMSLEEVQAKLEAAMQEKADRKRKRTDDDDPPAEQNEVLDTQAEGKAPLKHKPGKIICKKPAAGSLSKTPPKTAPACEGVRENTEKAGKSSGKIDKKPAAVSQSQPPPKTVLTHERSRHQFLVRIEGESSKVFGYQSDKKMPVALRSAKEHLIGRLRARGCSVPDKYL